MARQVVIILIGIRKDRGSKVIVAISAAKYCLIHKYPGTVTTRYGLFSVPAPPFRLAADGGVFLRAKRVFRAPSGGR